MLNPFYLYSLIWTVVFFLHSLKWSGLYLELTTNIIVFFIITINFSLLLGILLRKRYTYNIKLLKKYECLDIKIKLPIYFILIGHLIEFYYVGKIPLIEILKKTTYTYKDYTGIKTFHVILMTFNSYYAIFLSYLYIRLKKKKYLLGYFICLLPICLLYLRGNIILIFFITTLIYLGCNKLRLKQIVTLVVFSFFSMYIFGIIGNTRHHFKWNDTSYLNKIGKNTYSVKYLDPLFWSYIYISSPLSNLQNNINLVNPEYNFEHLLLRNLFPDFIQKRIEVKKEETKLISPNLTVSTSLKDQYNIYGLEGMYIIFFIYTVFNLSYTFVISKKSLYYIPGIGILSCIVVFSFFNNMYTFSGLSFQLVYPVINYLFFEKKIKKNIR